MQYDEKKIDSLKGRRRRRPHEAFINKIILNHGLERERLPSSFPPGRMCHFPPRFSRPQYILSSLSLKSYKLGRLQEYFPPRNDLLLILFKQNAPATLALLCLFVTVCLAAAFLWLSLQYYPYFILNFLSYFPYLLSLSPFFLTPFGYVLQSYPFLNTQNIWVFA